MMIIVLFLKFKDQRIKFMLKIQMKQNLDILFKKLILFKKKKKKKKKWS